MNKNLCASYGRELALSPNGLPLLADYAKGSYSGRELQCLRPGKITFRVACDLRREGRAGEGAHRGRDGEDAYAACCTRLVAEARPPVRRTRRASRDTDP